MIKKNYIVKVKVGVGNIQGFWYFAEKKRKISRDFQGQIRGKIGRFCGIFTGEKSKFAEKSADFTGF